MSLMVHLLSFYDSEQKNIRNKPKNWQLNHFSCAIFRNWIERKESSFKDVTELGGGGEGVKDFVTTVLGPW